MPECKSFILYPDVVTELNVLLYLVPLIYVDPSRLFSPRIFAFDASKIPTGVL